MGPRVEPEGDSGVGGLAGQQPLKSKARPRLRPGFPVAAAGLARGRLARRAQPRVDLALMLLEQGLRLLLQILGAVLAGVHLGVVREDDGNRDLHDLEQRSEERGVGKECVSTCSSGWSAYT